jgi:hypothetical protein
MKKLAALALLFIFAVPVLGDRTPDDARGREPRSKSVVRIIKHVVRVIGVTADFPTTPKP